jgi:hypothetical protein
LLVESNCKALGVNFINVFSDIQQVALSDKDTQDNFSLAEFTWYKYLIYFLLELKPPDGMGKSKARALNIKVVNYFFIDQVLYWKYPLGCF